MSDISKKLMPKEIGALKSLIQKIRDRHSGLLLEARLFGSRARDDATAESDIDLALITAKGDHDTKGLIFDMAYDVFLDTEVNISPLVISRDEFERERRLERRLVLDIEREGIRID